jgi:uncharacterized membrane protein
VPLAPTLYFLALEEKLRLSSCLVKIFFLENKNILHFPLDKICKLATITACLFYATKSKNKSFTLLEIVFTIVIIGILRAIFLPAMSSIKLAVQKVKDQSNLKTIAAAWKEYTID